MATQIQLVDGGIEKLLRFAINSSPVPATDLIAALAVNNVAFVCANTITDYTECTAGGYARVTLLGLGWTGVGVSLCIGDAHYPPFTFFFTDDGGGQIIYHLLILDSLGTLIGVANLPTPYAIPPSGGALTINLEWQQKNCP